MKFVNKQSNLAILNKVKILYREVRGSRFEVRGSRFEVRGSRFEEFKNLAVNIARFFMPVDGSFPHVEVRC